jgi:hypothetical protein
MTINTVQGPARSSLMFGLLRPAQPNGKNIVPRGAAEDINDRRPASNRHDAPDLDIYRTLLWPVLSIIISR